MTHRLRTKIVCTIGPASWEPAILRELVTAGMDVARLNFSHGDHTSHAESIRRIRAAAEAVGRPVAILADLQGPKLRVGIMPAGGVLLVPGQRLALTTEPVVGMPGRVPVQYERLPEVVAPGDRILIDDGLLEVVVQAVAGQEIVTEVVTGGVLESNKGLNLPRASLAIPAITDKDREDLRFAVGQGVDWVALSFVRTADEVLELRASLRDLSAFGHPTPVMAKIEKPEAIANIDAIVQAADGIMVARGDLGIEMSPEAVPMLQKMIIRKCRQAGKPVITATQMLDSMIRNPRPTRAEASDVANAILDGSDAIMLSGETAAGKYPVEAVRTMARIAEQAERGDGESVARQLVAAPSRSFAEAVARASVETAIDLRAAAIVAPTVSGATARSISRFRPPCPIVAVTPSPLVQRELVLSWGIYPILSQRAETTDAVMRDAVDAAHRHGFVAPGDIVIVTAGTVELGVGATNLMKVDLIERVVARGVGVTEHRLIGRVRRLAAPVSADVRVEGDEIIVAYDTDRTFVPVLRRAAGLIAGNPDPAAHSRLLAVELGLPAVVGVGEGLAALQEGMAVVMDAKRGVVFERPPALVQPPGRDVVLAGGL